MVLFNFVFLAIMGSIFLYLLLNLTLTSELHSRYMSVFWSVLFFIFQLFIFVFIWSFIENECSLSFLSNYNLTVVVLMSVFIFVLFVGVFIFNNTRWGLVLLSCSNLVLFSVNILLFYWVEFDLLFFFWSYSIFYVAD